MGADAPSAVVLERDEILSLIDRLVDKSLAVWEEGRGYRLLHIVRSYAREKLDEYEEGDRLRLKQFHYYREFAGETESRMRGPEQQRWQSLYASVLDDIRSALDFGYSRSEFWTAASEMTFDLTTHWFNSGSFSEAVGYYNQALNCCPPGESDLRARLLRRGGMMRVYYGDPNAGAILRDALSMAERVGSPQTLADAHFSLGLFLSDPESAINQLETALKMFEAIGDETGVGFALGGLGEVAFTQSRFSEANDLFHRALTITEASGDLRSAGASMGSLGAIELELGNPALARDHLLVALNLIVESSSTFTIYSMFPLVVRYVAQSGQTLQAAKLLGWSEKVRRGAGGIRDKMDQFIYVKTEGELREMLGSQVYEALQAEGAAMSFDDAIALAFTCLGASA